MWNQSINQAIREESIQKQDRKEQIDNIPISSQRVSKVFVAVYQAGWLLTVIATQVTTHSAHSVKACCHIENPHNVSQGPNVAIDIDKTRLQ